MHEERDSEREPDTNAAAYRVFIIFECLDYSV